MVRCDSDLSRCGLVLRSYDTLYLKCIDFVVITRCTADIQASMSTLSLTTLATHLTFPHTVDRPLPDTFFILLTLTLSLATKLGIVVFLTPVFIFPGLLVFVIGGMCGRLYIASQLAVKRQQSVAKAPILAHFGGTLSGLGRSRSFELTLHNTFLIIISSAFISFCTGIWGRDCLHEGVAAIFRPAHACS